MTHSFKNKLPLFGAGASLSAVALLAGCGGGGGGGGSTPSGTPSPFDATYNATYTTSDSIPNDGKAPTGNLVVARGRALSQTTFYLQPSVVSSVQSAVNEGLRANNVGYAIPDNQVPQSIAFSGTGQVDGSGKLVLTSKKSVPICGTATLVIRPTFLANGATASGAGTYEIIFPPNLVAKIRGRDISIRTSTNGTPFTCNNLPLRKGTVSFTR